MNENKNHRHFNNLFPKLKLLHKILFFTFNSSIRKSLLNILIHQIYELPAKQLIILLTRSHLISEKDMQQTLTLTSW